MSSRTLNLNETIYEYLLGNIHREPDAAKELRIATSRTHGRMSIMQISPEQGAFMALLCRILNAKRTIEVGTFTGYSTLVVADVLPDDGRIVACDISETWTNLGQEHWERAGVAHKIDLRIAPAMETLDQLIEEGQLEAYDFAFIDADKNNYDGYYERCLKLIRNGGIVAIDNVLWGGRTADPTVADEDTVAIRELNKKVSDDPRVFATMIPIGDGLTLAQKL